MGPCDEEAARRARDTACRVLPPTRCPPVGAQGLESRAALSEGDLLSCPGLRKGPGGPAGCQEVMGLVPAALFPTVLLQQGRSRRPVQWGVGVGTGVGEAGRVPWVPGPGAE